MRRSQLVAVTSSTLRDDKKGLHGNVLQFHHGVATDFFLNGTPRPYYRRFCYFGTLRNELDYKAVEALAEAGFSVELVGPVRQALPPMHRNVVVRPAVPANQLPKALTHYDALLLPYRDDEYNRGILPAKIYECLATGKPVLSSPLPALGELKDHLYICRTLAEWVEAARELPDAETAARRAARVQAAAEHTHEKAFSRLKSAVAACLSNGHGR
jgi:glycosyltransferase involved in cell wall biosynthesis